MRRWLIALLILCIGACDSCLTDKLGCLGSGSSLATLKQYAGQAQVERKQKSGAWAKAAVGEKFRAGDALRTGGGSKAYIELTRGGRIRMGERSLIRFSSKGDKASRLNVEIGSAELEGGNGDVYFDTVVGLARLDKGSRIVIGKAEMGLNVDVLVGTAYLEGKPGQSTKLTQGQNITIEFGGAIIDRNAPKKVETPPPAPEPGKIEEPEEPAAAKSVVTLVVKGNGARVRLEGEKKWQALEAGTTEGAPGSALQLKNGTSIEVTRGAEQASVAGVADAVIGKEGEELLRVTRGHVSAVSKETSVRIALPGGYFVLRGDSGGKESRAEVNVQRSPGSTVTSQRGELELKGRVQAEVLTAGETAVLKPNGDIELDMRIPKVADFAIPAGESPMIHDPHPPTAIRFVFGKACPGEATLEIPKRGMAFTSAIWKSPGKESANFEFPPGTHAYRVRCGNGPAVSTGKIHISKDTGRADLPRLAPKTMVDADGRKYTVLYQNLLPELLFRWDNAAAGPQGYLLHLDAKKGKSRTFSTPEPRYTTKSGEIPEGIYDMWFEPNGNPAKKSPTTTLRIGYDNAAPSASITSPTSGEVTRGAKLEVSGVSMEGWSVRVGKTEVPLDDQARFNTTVVAPTDENSIAIRISHPSRGIHYYLRKILGPKP